VFDGEDVRYIYMKPRFLMQESSSLRSRKALRSSSVVGKPILVKRGARQKDFSMKKPVKLLGLVIGGLTMGGFREKIPKHSP
jgi:hypothetical protein